MDEIVGCVGAMLLGVLLFIGRGVMFMWAVSLAHAWWIPSLPTIGVWHAVVISGLIGLAFVSVTSTAKK